MKLKEILEKSKSGELKNLKFFIDPGYELTIYKDTKDDEIINPLHKGCSFRFIEEVLKDHNIEDVT